MPGRELGHGEPEVFVLPDGRRIACPRRHSASVLWREINDGFYAEAVRGPLHQGAIVDVGANIGLASIFFSDHFPDRHVLALEPAEACFRCLCQNVARHAPNVTAIRVAAGAATVMGELVYYPNAPEQSTLNPDADEQATTARSFFANSGLTPRMRDSLIEAMFTPERTLVPVTTIGSILDQHDIETVALLKLDVEGGELDALKGIGLVHWPRIDRLVIEVHDRAGRLGHIRALLEHHGYEVTVEQAPWFAGTNIFGVLAVRSGQPSSPGHRYLDVSPEPQAAPPA
jgi:31-O-methyltransferase